MTPPNLTTSRRLRAIATPYNQVEVIQRGRRVDFDVTGATFATWHPDEWLTGYSWDALAAGCALHTGVAAPRILLLGLAGGTLVRQLHALLPRARVTAIEIDPVLVELGNTFMELDQFGCEVLIDDAYAFLGTTRRRFDIVVDDVYRSGAHDVERPLDQIEGLLSLWQRVLRPGGLLLANFITDGSHNRLSRAARRAFRDSFPDTRVIIPPEGYNAIVAGGNDLAPTPDIRRLGDRFSAPSDQKLWNAIRILPRA